MSHQSPQTELFPPEGAAFHKNDPVTAKAAAKSVDTSFLETMVLNYLRDNPAGLTAHEIATKSGESLVTISPRMRPLVRRGLVEDSGETRATDSGRQAIVWRIRHE